MRGCQRFLLERRDKTEKRGRKGVDVEMGGGGEVVTFFITLQFNHI